MLDHQMFSHIAQAFNVITFKRIVERSIGSRYELIIQRIETMCPRGRTSRDVPSQNQGQQRKFQICYCTKAELVPNVEDELRGWNESVRR